MPPEGVGLGCRQKPSKCSSKFISIDGAVPTSESKSKIRSTSFHLPHSLVNTYTTSSVSMAGELLVSIAWCSQERCRRLDITSHPPKNGSGVQPSRTCKYLYYSCFSVETRLTSSAFPQFLPLTGLRHFLNPKDAENQSG